SQGALLPDHHRRPRAPARGNEELGALRRDRHRDPDGAAQLAGGRRRRMIREGVRRFFNLALRRRDQWEREVEDEIRFHLELRAEQLAAQGMSPEVATAEAVRRFGALSTSRARLLDAARHREHHMQRTEFLADLKQDISFALRTLGRQKAWTIVTIATLALGIGAT